MTRISNFNNSQQLSPLDRFLNVRETCRIAGGITRVTLWRLERDGLFPKRHRISPNRVGWLESDLRNWIAERSGQTSNQEGEQRHDQRKPV